MNATVRNTSTMRPILWVDALAGGSTALIGLLFYSYLTILLGLPKHLIVTIAAVTLLYALVALSLVLQRTMSVALLRLLIYANWIWTFISVGLLAEYARTATTLGTFFLVLQVVVVGGLAYAEGRQLKLMKQLPKS